MLSIRLQGSWLAFGVMLTYFFPVRYYKTFSFADKQQHSARFLCLFPHWRHSLGCVDEIQAYPPSHCGSALGLEGGMGCPAALLAPHLQITWM